MADEGWTVPNDESGIETLVEQLRERPVDLVVLEATGGYEMATAVALAEAGLPVVVANPRQVPSHSQPHTPDQVAPGVIPRPNKVRVHY